MKLPDIMHIESTNTSKIHLYPYKGGAWIAYGESARLLIGLYPNLNYSEKIFVQYGIKCYSMIIDSFSLADLLDKVAILERTSTKIEIVPF